MADDSLTPADFEAVFNEHAAFAWRVLRRYGVPESELEDASQEVFLVLHRKLPEFAGRSSMRTFVYSVAARVAIGLKRKARFRRETPLPVGAEHSTPELERPTPFDAAVQRQALASIEAALATLDPEKREVFALYELEGMTMAETASALSVPENTGLSRLYAAREEIRAHIRRQNALPPRTRRSR